MECERISTKVCIIGAGPAGMLLSNLLLRAKIECLVVDRLSREEIFSRARAGLIEHRNVELLKTYGLADRMLLEGHAHSCIEFRAGGKGFLFDYAKLCGGRSSWVYPQQELVSDLPDAVLRAGGDIRFGVPAEKIELGAHPIVTCNGGKLVIDCDFVVGCDGFHGVSRTAIPNGALREFARQYEFEWLAVLVQAPPSSAHAIYALHPRGFAGHMLRNATQSRFYLQVDQNSAVEDWPDQRIWTELGIRMAKDGWVLNKGPVIARSLLEMRSYVGEPMQYERLFLVGDAAHIITPAGGKGMNLAIQDAEELAQGLRALYASRDENRLGRYSATRLPRVWQAMEFSNWMIEVMHAASTDRSDAAYTLRLQEARLEHLARKGSLAADFAEAYVGLA
jgi:p-hydroxybenzoate 3-monooxygenase